MSAPKGKFGTLIAKLNANKVKVSDLLGYIGDLNEELINEFSYLGFDHVAVLANYKKLCDNDETKMATRLLTCTIMVVTRGTNITKIMDKSGAEIKDALSDLKLAITAKGGKKLKNDDVTPARLVAIFPEVTCKIAHPIARSKVPMFVSLTGILATNLFASMVPLENHDMIKAMLKVNFMYLREFDKIINVRKQTDIKTLKMYYDNAHNSTILSSTERMRLFKDMKLGAYFNEFVTNPVNKSIIDWMNHDDHKVEGFEITILNTSYTVPSGLE